MATQLKSRKRAPSVQQAIHDIETDKRHHLTGSFMPPTPQGSNFTTPDGSGFVNAKPRDDFYDSMGLWTDIKTLRWMRVPSSSFKILIIPIILYVATSLFNIQPNPFAPMLFISHPVSDSNADDPRYAKGWLDVVFILYHIIVFSFIRQFFILVLVFPIARRLGIRRQHKLDRFGEQAYAMAYYGTMGFWGLYIMSTLPTWFYRTEYYWKGYPYWDMNAVLKRYYLMHFSYWIQQLIVLALKIEKPRKDFQELVAHHIVTLWLIGWSYGINLTLIGNAVFVSMDIPDTFLAFSKLCNYLGLEMTKTISVIIFAGVWSYFRHWLNWLILYSVWTEFDIIPASARFFDPPNGVWMVWWMKYQIFVPILLLQLLNIFWYFLILRIIYRTLKGHSATDDRSDDEDEGDDDDKDEKKEE